VEKEVRMNLPIVGVFVIGTLVWLALIIFLFNSAACSAAMPC